MRARIALAAALAAALPLAALLLTALAAPAADSAGTPPTAAAQPASGHPAGDAFALPGAMGALPDSRPGPGVGAVDTAGPAAGKGLLRVRITNDGGTLAVALRITDAAGLPVATEVATIPARSTWVRDVHLPLGRYTVEADAAGTQAVVRADLASCPSRVVEAAIAMAQAVGPSGVTLASMSAPAACR
jgi:hypothetical protein